MRKASLFAAVLLLISFAACEFPKYPIDDPAVVKIDTRLIGKWRMGDKKSGDSYRFVVTKHNDYQYKIVCKEKVAKQQLYAAFLSKVDTMQFLNVYCNKDTDKSYLLMRIMDFNNKGDRFMICSVTDTMMQYLTSSAQVREYVAKHLNNPSFYEDTNWVYKVK